MRLNLFDIIITTMEESKQHPDIKNDESLTDMVLAGIDLHRGIKPLIDKEKWADALTTVENLMCTVLMLVEDIPSREAIAEKLADNACKKAAMLTASLSFTKEKEGLNTKDEQIHD